MKKSYSTQEIAAALAGCAPESMLAFAIRDDGTAVVINPIGQKFTYSPDELAARVQQLEALEPARSPISGKTVPKLETVNRTSIVGSVSKLETKSTAVNPDPTPKVSARRGEEVTRPLETQYHSPAGKPAPKKPRAKK